jgi:polyribonucleotide nucleotidyltransferase
LDDLVVLTTVVAKKEADPAKRLLPFSSFLSRKILCNRGNSWWFFKREARPTERETLTSRLIDRPIRPMFPEILKMRYKYFVQ